MNKIINLDMELQQINDNEKISFMINEYDDVELNIKIYNGIEEIDLNNKSISLLVIKEDNKKVLQKENIEVIENVLKIKLNKQATTKKGICKAQILIMDKTGAITTAETHFLVSHNLYTGIVDLILSTDDIYYLKLIEDFLSTSKEEIENITEALKTINEKLDELKGEIEQSENSAISNIENKKEEVLINIDEVKEEAKNEINGTKDEIINVSNEALNQVNQAKEEIEGVKQDVEGLVNTVEATKEEITETTKEEILKIQQAGQTATQSVSNTKDAIITEINEEKDQAIQDIQGTKTEIINNINTSKQEAINSIGEAKTGAINEIQGAKNGIIEEIKGEINAEKDLIVEGAKNEINAGKDEIIEQAKGALNSHKETLINQISERAGEIKTETIEGIKAAKPEIIEEIKAEITTEKDAIISGATEAINGKKDEAINAITAKKEEVLTGFTEVLEGKKDEVLTGLDDTLSEKKQNIINTTNTELEGLKTDVISEINTNKTNAINEMGTTKTGAISEINTNKTNSINSIGEAKTGAINEITNTKNQVLTGFDEALEEKKNVSLSDVDDTLNEKKENIINTTNEALEEVKTGAINEVGTTKTEAISSINEAKTGTINEIGTNKTNAINEIGTNKTEAVKALNNTKDEAINGIEETKTTTLSEIELKILEINQELESLILVKDEVINANTEGGEVLAALLDAIRRAEEITGVVEEYINNKSGNHDEINQELENIKTEIEAIKGDVKELKEKPTFVGSMGEGLYRPELDEKFNTVPQPDFVPTHTFKYLWMGDSANTKALVCVYFKIPLTPESGKYMCMDNNKADGTITFKNVDRLADVKMYSYNIASGAAQTWEEFSTFKQPKLTNKVIKIYSHDFDIYTADGSSVIFNDTSKTGESDFNKAKKDGLYSINMTEDEFNKLFNGPKLSQGKAVIGYLDVKNIQDKTVQTLILNSHSEVFTREISENWRDITSKAIIKNPVNKIKVSEGGGLPDIIAPIPPLPMYGQKEKDLLIFQAKSNLYYVIRFLEGWAGTITTNASTSLTVNVRTDKTYEMYFNTTSGQWREDESMITTNLGSITIDKKYFKIFHNTMQVMKDGQVYQDITIPTEGEVFITDLNEALQSGIYDVDIKDGDEILNTPLTTRQEQVEGTEEQKTVIQGDFKGLLQTTVLNSDIYQELYSADNTKAWKRTRQGGEWKPWRVIITEETLFNAIKAYVKN